MPLKRTSVDLSVEQDLPGAPGVRARLSAHYELPGEGAPSPEELEAAIEGLRQELGRAVGVPVPERRRDRPLEELVGTYRPRQGELVDLLHEEGELTDGEHALLREYVAAQHGASAPSPTPSPSPALALNQGGAPPSSLAAAPVSAERLAGPTRPVPELLREYQIASLRQAGAVRARRQISYEEYMALKRHFAAVEAGAPPAPTGQ
jgi:hypothetical protein